MLRFLYLMMIVPILFCSQANVMVDLFNEVSMIEVYNNGQIIEMSEEEQNKFDDLFCEAISGAKQMPAFGVSLHDLTIEEMKEGIWVKFIFDKTIVRSEMPFDELLIHVQKDCHGFNVIRGNNGRYEGRCYYLDLEGTLDDVYDFLCSIEGKQNSEVEVELDSQEVEETSIVCENSDDNDGDDNKDNNLSDKQERKPSVINQSTDIENNANENLEDNVELNKSQKELLNHLQ